MQKKTAKKYTINLPFWRLTKDTSHKMKKKAKLDSFTKIMFYRFMKIIVSFFCFINKEKIEYFCT